MPEGGAIKLGFDPAKSLAIIIGCPSCERDGSLARLDAVHHNVMDLEALLRDPNRIGFQRILNLSHVTYPRCLEIVGETFDQEQKKHQSGANVCHLIYYAGHGLIGRNSTGLLLGAENTTSAWREFNGIPYRGLRNLLDYNSHASIKVVILDCCFAGLAMEEPAVRAVTEEVRSSTGSFAVMASPRDQVAYWPHGARNTGFTDKLLGVLRDGLAGQAQALSIGQIFQAVRRRCLDANLPEPETNSIRDGHNIAFALNAAFNAAEADELAQSVLNDAGVDVGGRSKKKRTDPSELLSIAYARLRENSLSDNNRELAAEVLRLPHVRSWLSTRRHRNEVVTAENTVITIAPNGDTHCAWRRTLKPRGGNIDMVVQAAFGEKETQTFDEITVRAEFQGRDGEIVVLPIEEQPKLKLFALAFVPPIEGKDPVNLTVSWNWPEMFCPLIQKGHDEWRFSVKSASAMVQEETTTFRIHQHALRGRKLQVVNRAAGGGHLKYNGFDHSTQHECWMWVMNEVAAGSRVVLSMDLVDSEGQSLAKP